MDYTLVDFGDAFSELVPDPSDGANVVVRTMKPFAAASWAGTTMGVAPNGFATAVPFGAGNTQITVRVYSPDVGVPVLLKAEDATDDTVTVETLATTTVADAWETLTFDFSNQREGTAALNLENTYDKVSIFFNFGFSGEDVGVDKTYYWDDVQFVEGGDGGDGGGDSGGLEGDPLYATSAAVTIPSTISDWGSGTMIVTDHSGDTTYNPSIQLISGTGWGDVSALAFTAIEAGKILDYTHLEFKIKTSDYTTIRVKMPGATTEEPTFNISDGTPLTDGWVQMSIELTAFGTIPDSINEFALLEFGAGQILVTDVLLSGDSGAGSLEGDPLYATSAAVTIPSTISDWGSGTMIVTDHSGDTTYNPSIQLISGTGWGDVSALAFTAIEAGKILDYTHLEFKIKTSDYTTIRVKMPGATTEEPTFNISDGTPLTDGWVQMSIELTAFGTIPDSINEFALLEFGAGQILVTDVLLSGEGGGAGGGDGGDGGECAGDPGGDAGELTTNGGLEACSFTGWALYNTLPVLSTDSATGDYAANLNASGAFAVSVLKQERIAAGTVAKGQTLNISFKLKGTFLAGAVLNPNLIYEDDTNVNPPGAGSSNDILETIVIPTADYSTYSYTQVVNGNVGDGISLEFALACGGAETCSGDAFIDDVSITIQE